MKMRSVTPMRVAKTGYILMSLVFCALGLLFILRPDQSLAVMGRVLGIAMIAFGAFKLVGYFPGTCTGWPSSMTWSSASC